MIEELFLEYIRANDDFERAGIKEKLVRELKWQHVQEHLISILDELDCTFAVDRDKGSLNIWTSSGERFIYFPMKDRLLITKENRWESGGLNWMNRNIDYRIQFKYFDIDKMLSNYKEHIE